MVGLVGGIASGKSTALSILEGLGADVIDADALCHDVYGPNSDAFDDLVATFGPSIVQRCVWERTMDRLVACCVLAWVRVECVW